MTSGPREPLLATANRNGAVDTATEEPRDTQLAFEDCLDVIEHAQHADLATKQFSKYSREQGAAARRGRVCGGAGMDLKGA